MDQRFRKLKVLKAIELFVLLVLEKPLLLSVHQCLLRLIKSTKIDPLKPCVCLGAFTAAAERNVGGATLHILLAKPTNSERALAMVFATQSRLRQQYSQLRVLIIDEKSLVGNYFLHIIDQHLRIKNCDEPLRDRTNADISKTNWLSKLMNYCSY